MNGKILGIPLVLILLVIIIALVVDLPMVLFNRDVKNKIDSIELQTKIVNDNVQRLLVTPIPTVTATPSATVSPTVLRNAAPEKATVTAVPTK